MPFVFCLYTWFLPWRDGANMKLWVLITVYSFYQLKSGRSALCSSAQSLEELKLVFCSLCSRCLTMSKDSGQNFCYGSSYPGASKISWTISQRISQGTCLSVQYVVFTFSHVERLQSRARNVVSAMELSSLKIQINGNNRTYYFSKPQINLTTMHNDLN